MSCYVMLDGVFLFMIQKSTTECIRIKKIKNPEDDYVAVETLVCLLHERIYSVMGSFCVHLTSTVDCRRVVSFRLQPLYTHGKNLAAVH